MSFWRNPSLRRPAITGVVGLLLAVVTLRLDAALPSGWLFGLQPPVAGTRAVLGAVLSSIITVSALVFWVRGMFVQLSAGQFSSRVLRWYLADNYQQRVLDFLVGVFGYVTGVTLTLGGSPTAPALSTVVAVSLSLCALIVVIVTITDSARATELTGVMAQIAERTIGAVRDAHPERGKGITRRSDSSAGDATRSGDRLLVHAPASGWVGHIDDARLAATLPANTTVRIWTRAGTFVVRDSIVGDVEPGGDVDPSAVGNALDIGRTRDVANDVELGMRELIDIALQALAVGTRDTTSGYEAINYLAFVVHEILLRDLPDDVYVGHDGRRVVRMAELTYEDYVNTAFDQIRLSGAGYPAIASALLTALRMLADAVAQTDLPERLDPLQRQIDLVLDRLEQADLPQHDRQHIDGDVVAWRKPAE
ncbi:MAG: DUF2254 domain-containing protein [Actinobacteria bacterium]|nr:DUF2254 domain-containing protein [Actinomycetota bacterium]